MLGAAKLHGAGQVELRIKSKKLPGAHQAVDLIVALFFQELFPQKKRIGVGSQTKNAAAHIFQFLMIIAADGGTDKTDRIFPDVVLTYESVMPAAVYKSERSRRQLIGGVDVCRIVAVEFPGAFCRMQQAEGIQARDFLRKRRCDGDLPSAEQIRKAFAEIIIPPVNILKVIGE